MSGIHAPVRFFLGANTPGGFVGYIDDLYDAKDGWQAYIIKSGPGTGKSSLRRAARELLGEAVAISAEAKALHDKMEQFNIAAMDWQQAEDITRSTATLFAAAALGAAEA